MASSHYVNDIIPLDDLTFFIDVKDKYNLIVILLKANSNQSSCSSLKGEMDANKEQSSPCR
jgi:hypothetical protein